MKICAIKKKWRKKVRKSISHFDDILTTMIKESECKGRDGFGSDGFMFWEYVKAYAVGELEMLKDRNWKC